MPLEAYAAFLDDEIIRLQSSSGGIFTALARCILYNHGVVYGVAMAEDCKSAEVVRVDSVTALVRLRGSKYMQASTGDCFQKAKTDLEAGLLVLYSGTPCQINGLKLFLQKDYSNLLCVDIICHGVPSPLLWKKNVSDLEHKQSKKLKAVNFRAKRPSAFADVWGNLSPTKQISVPFGQDSYMKMFLNNYCLRPSCYKCASKVFRLSDLSIGDFWGIENVAPEMNDAKGISLVIIRSEKGREFFCQLEGIREKKVRYEDAIRENEAESTSVSQPAIREQFFNDLSRLNYSEMEERFFPVPLKRRIKNLLLKTPARSLLEKKKRGLANMDYYVQYTLGCRTEKKDLK